jgi:hypothetical protein
MAGSDDRREASAGALGVVYARVEGAGRIQGRAGEEIDIALDGIDDGAIEVMLGLTPISFRVFAMLVKQLHLTTR